MLVPTIAAEALTEFAARLLTAGGVGGEEAMLIARSLVGANLRGYDSHGVMRIPQYLSQIEKGEIVPGARFEVLKETPALLTTDGHWGFGRVQAGRLTERLIEKARRSGVGVGTMIRCAHTGRLGEYCEMATAAGLVAMVMVNNHGAVRRVAPPGGKAARLSTNPIAVGIPHEKQPIVLDFCTCVAAEGKVRVKWMAGQRCPDGWLLDSEGRSTNDPAMLYADPPGTILPMGGSQPYKGFGLSLVVEVLTGALSGGVCAREVPINPIGNCVFMLVMDPAHFGGSGHFGSEVSQLIEFIRGCPRIEGVEEITLPGDPERRSLVQKSAEGLSLDEGNWSKLLDLAESLGVDPPAA
jgi:uncharacterized oxidoreductase